MATSRTRPFPGLLALLGRLVTGLRGAGAVWWAVPPVPDREERSR